MKKYHCVVLLSILLALLASMPIAAGEKILRPHFSYVNLAECLDEFRDREFFEFIYREAWHNPEAKNLFMLGYLYHHGIGVEKNSLQAQRWYTKAVDRGYSFPRLGNEAAEGLVELSHQQSNGSTEEANDTAIADLEKQRAAAGAKAMLELGMQYLYGLCVALDFEKSMYWELQAASTGNREACLVVSNNYSMGLNAYPRDQEESYRWQARSALQVNVGALASDLDVDALPVIANEPVSKYAQRIYSQGLKAYRKKSGKSKYYQAGVYFSQAAGFEVDIAENYFLLGLIQEKGLCGVKNNYAAAKNYRTAADLGHAKALLRLAMFHEAGIGVRRSRKEAERLYKAALALGNEKAEQRLRKLQEEWPTLPVEDWEQSQEWKEIIRTAQFRAYYNRSPFNLPDETKASVAYLLRAAENGQVYAQHEAGLLYQNGMESIGLRADRYKAEYWFSRYAQSKSLLESN